MKYLRIVIKFLIVYISLVIVFTLSLTVVSSLPSDSIRSNIIKSIPLLEQEGDYPLVGGEQSDYQLDNYTDSIMLNIIYNIDSTKPFDAGLQSVLYSLPGVGLNWRVQSLKAQIGNNEPGNGNYPTYWHGYIVIIRPLLTFATFSDIRKIYELAFFLLFSIITSLLYKKVSMAAALAFATSLALINFMIVPFSISFSSDFFVAFIFMIILLLMPNIDIQKASLLFFIVGACTSFVDLSATPIVTFGLPAVVVLILRKQLTPKSPIKSDIIFLVCIGLTWLAGYALLWTSKWGLASIVLQKNVFAEGVMRIFVRTGGVIPSWLDDGTPLWIHAISSNVYYIFSSGYSKPISWLLLYLIPGLFLITFIRWHQRIRDLSLSLLLFVLAALPYAYFIFASELSAVHCWLTYRIQAVTIMAVLCAMYYAIDWKNMFLDINKLFRTLKSWGTRSKTDVI